MGGAFPATRHSVIERLRAGDPEGRRTAFGDLVDGYWKPVYKHLRYTWQLRSDDAQDVVQSFFAEAFQKAWLEQFDPSKARFRTFVRLCVDRFVMKARQADSRIKRGGGVSTIALDFNAVEREVARMSAATMPDPDVRFHQEFVRSLFERTVAAVRAEYAAGARQTPFALFERYDLSGDEALSYGRLAREFGLTTAQVTNALAQVRRRFRDRALDSLRALCGSDDEFRREARDLFGFEVE